MTVAADFATAQTALDAVVSDIDTLLAVEATIESTYTTVKRELLAETRLKCAEARRFLDDYTADALTAQSL